MWICVNESPSFWMTVLTDLKNRGVEDIGITSTDNLKGFTKANFYRLSHSPNADLHCASAAQLTKFVVWKR